MLPLEPNTRNGATRTYLSASSRSPVVRRHFPGAGSGRFPLGRVGTRRYVRPCPGPPNSQKGA